MKKEALDWVNCAVSEAKMEKENLGLHLGLSAW
jgi:hypothetical protein